MSKSFLTNLIAVIVFLVAYWSPSFTGQVYLTQAALFALSGALTNWLAIHMLFEKVPGFYGSGIIPLHFEEFKSGIRSLIMDNFFTETNFAQMTEKTLPTEIPTDWIAGQVDFERVFDGFVLVIKESPFGGMLGLVGGEQALQPLKAPFQKEFHKQLQELLSKIDVTAILRKEIGFEEFRPKVEWMVDDRLAELSPEQVRQIIDQMIREHLGWLVVWGGVFGAAIGLVSTIVLN